MNADNKNWGKGMTTLPFVLEGVGFRKARVVSSPKKGAFTRLGGETQKPNNKREVKNDLYRH